MSVRAALALALLSCTLQRPASPPDAGPPPPVLEDESARATRREVDALEAKVRAGPAAFAPEAALGDLLFDRGRYVEAVDAYRRAVEKAAPALALIDTLTPPDGGSRCDAPGAGFDDRLDLARRHSTAGDARSAWGCAKEVLDEVHRVMVSRGNAQLMLGNADQALALYDQVLRRDPRNLEASFFLGGVVLRSRGDDARWLERALVAWRGFLAAAPARHPLRPEVEDQLPELEKALARARVASRPTQVGTDEHAVALEQAEDALARGDPGSALDLYLTLREQGHSDPAMDAGLAATRFLIGSADAASVFDEVARRWPDAIDALAGRLLAKGNPGLARTLRQRLAARAPDGG